MMNIGFTLALLGLLAVFLVWIAVVDVRTYTISDGLNLTIALLAPVYWWSAGVPFWPDAAIRVGVAVVVFLLFAGAFYMNVMGGGDVKLAGALALWFTPYETITLIVIMSIAGGVLTLLVMGIHHARKKIGRPEVPYGVAIAVGGMWLLAQRFLNHFA
ncbi:prepilin peptidase [Sphingomonas sp. G124]|uniref:Prepilin peptidase n=1 Tax=Sphingomonas cremea TaxID=2904799 RepID=A0A9X1TX71_9SPHN|nr:prepilin peptidase [Sphingomonas cremea]MCF2513848.1 prepilin peptidase [Sphingomonas cremea]